MRYPWSVDLVICASVFMCCTIFSRCQQPAVMETVPPIVRTPYATIKNAFTSRYLYESDNGYVLYGPLTRENAGRFQWRFVTARTTGRSAIENMATRHFILPIEDSDVLVATDSVDPYRWLAASGSIADAMVFQDSLHDGNYLHVENAKGYAEDSGIPVAWSSPQWFLQTYHAPQNNGKLHQIPPYQASGQDVHRGAEVPFIAYEAEDGATNAFVFPAGRKYGTIQSEASGRRAVKLESIGDYVEIVLTKAANGFVIRYCIPDSDNGGGIQTTLDLYVDGQRDLALPLTSKFAWSYGVFPYTKNPHDGQAHAFFDEKRILLDRMLPAGTKIRLQKDPQNDASFYVIDFIDAEEVLPPSQRPANSISITDYGAVPGGQQSAQQALADAIKAAAFSGREVWIPAGEFYFPKNTRIEIASDKVTIRGAGMWHTTLVGPGAGFIVKASNVGLYDFSIRGVTSQREKDSNALTGVESDYGTPSMNNLSIKNLWIEHTLTGIWIHNMQGLTIANCRIRNISADGIHLRRGTSDAIVEKNEIRNTGDDGIALWSFERADTRNKIRFNTVSLPLLANGIAVYGGKNNEVTDNIVRDVVFAGGGINISSAFKPVPFSGIVLVARNTLYRTGSRGQNSDTQGAIWINAPEDINAQIQIDDDEAYDSAFEGLSVSGSASLQSIKVSNTLFEEGKGWGVYIGKNVKGKMKIHASGPRGFTFGPVFNGAGESLFLSWD